VGEASGGEVEKKGGGVAEKYDRSGAEHREQVFSTPHQ